MKGKIKNIIILVVVAVILILVYFYFIKGNSDQTALISSSPNPVLPANGANADSQITQDFLSLLLNVRSIKLDDTIFSDVAFKNLSDSSITLTPDGTEGRTNPFAPLGSATITAPVKPKTP